MKSGAKAILGVKVQILLCRRFASHLALIGVFALTPLISAIAQEKSTFESEPNNTPAEANPIAGATTVLGTMNENDQDGFMWTVSDEDAQKRWVFELHGIPGRLTVAEIVRVEFADNGVDVAGQERLMKMGTRDGYTPAMTQSLIFEPGEYLIGLAYAGGSPGQEATSGGMFRPPAANVSFGDDGDPDTPESAEVPADPEPGAYRFIIREGDHLGIRALPKKGTGREDAVGVRPNGEHAVFETRDTAWYSFDFKPEDTHQRWDIRVQVPIGRAVDATLFAADGQQLDKRRSGNRGNLAFPAIVPKDQHYLLQLEPLEPGFITAVASEAVGQRVEGEEAEPNGKWPLANYVDLSTPLSARVNEANETDYFKFTVGETTADSLQVVRIESEPSEQKMLFCLYDGDETRMQCRDDNTPIELPDLLLSPGEYGLSVTRARAEFDYTITLDEQGPVEAGVETEPNDEIRIATNVPANNRIKGRGSGKENDYYRFLVAEEAQLWRFQVIGEGISEVAYHDAAGHSQVTLRPKAGQRRLRLDDMFLLPGKHYIRVSASDGAQYALLARPLGPPDPNGEREPNDDTSRMQRLAIGQTRTGLLTDGNDNDYYRFFLANWDHVKLTVEPPPDGIVAPHLYWYTSSLAQGVPSETGQTMTFAGVFPPGDYYVQLKANQPSDAEYRLSLERLPRWSCASDCEPNGLNTYYGAASLPPTLVLEGVAGDWRDMDAYQLPVLDEPSRLVIRAAEQVARVHIGRGRHDSEALQYNAEAGTYTTTIPVGEEMRIIVESRGEPYRLELEFENGPRALADPKLAAELDLKFEPATVSAYRLYGQRLDGELTVANSGTGPLDAQLDATTSDYRWQVSLGEQELSLGPGANLSIPVEVHVPPDAWADRPVRISVRAFDDTGAQSETWAEIDVDRETLPVNLAWNWAIPDALRGGFNAAWLPFGGEFAGEVPRGADNPELRDGLVFERRRTECCGETYGWKKARPFITFELPGDGPMPVAGTAINHFGVPWPFRNVRQATLLLSQDGQSFDEVLNFETLPVKTEQFFALEEPVMARYARLRFEETFEQRSGAGGITMGEWKVILAPGHDLSGGAGFNIAAPEYGGHLAWDWPPSAYPPVQILDDEKPPNDARIGPNVELEYVIGFHEDRAAQIQRVEWINPENVPPETAFAKIIVSVSTESPIGPWATVGELDPGHSPEPETLRLEAPVWARFVKFTGVRQGDSGIALRPNVIRIWERPTGEAYRSILAEWGDLSRKSWYEEQAGIAPDPELTAGDNTSRERAAPLIPGQSARGQVELARESHWYRMIMPEDANTQIMAMSGQPTVRTVLELEDGDGTPVPTKKQHTESTPGRHVFEAYAEPGTELYFHVYEPPRNVIFTWDTSASVNAHLPTIYNSLSAFVSQVVPGQESANFVPFGRGALLDTWLGEPYMLQTILNDYPRSESSSSGEHALQNSAQVLAPVPGTKSIVTITDGAVVHHGPMWKEMREVQPRVFGVGVAGYEPGHIDVFQDWASVNGGHFTQLRYQGEMEVAFDRAATLMRRPADYTLEVQAEYREAPGPGLLQVLSAEETGADVTGGAVELILDASGSMLQRMEGKRRIVIAKEVLTQAVREFVPAGTPVALRVFGHTEPGTCDTELLMPLGPLDPDAAAQTIANVQAKNLAKTPIAGSLAAVSGDLGDTQAAAVILVTDGEETCEGDPAAAIESLREKGIDVVVNIVGFAIDDAALEAQFAEWADLGGGRYFSAQDQSGLSEALEEALQVPYAVFDSSGEIVAEGLIDGEPVELERGVYRIAVKTAPPQTFEKVEIQGEDEVVIRLE